jgi:2-polyprenyl-3-methyl-5-hydroxy-6-metoxy-1,4-benzoquinol methylase
MSRWFRHSPFNADFSGKWIEQWTYQPPDRVEQSYQVRVKAGKKFDVLSVKGTDLSGIRTYSRMLKRTSRALYLSSADTRKLTACPICDGSLIHASTVVEVFGIPYHRCPHCGHVFIAARPSVEALSTIFSESEDHSSVYVDHDAIEARMTQIIEPKLAWCVDQFRHCSRRRPESVVDVGAGGGHFLAGALRQGMAIEGYELSKSSRTFARDVFNLTLRDDDFLSTGPVGGKADLVTFWGLLEYAAKPRAFLAAARQCLTPDGMLIVEVPRSDALSTYVQAMTDAQVARHMDPTSHIHCFSDESLCTALVEEGFAPVAAWYFGMDAYEAGIQMALKSSNPDLLASMGVFIPILQKALDQGRQCDDLVLAAVPEERP